MKKALSRNFKVKILSVLVAFGMWVYVMEEIDPIMIKSLEGVPIDGISNIAEITDRGLTISYGQSLTVNVDLRGKRSQVLNYLNSDIKAKAYVENPKPGENILYLNLPAISGIEYNFNPRVNYINLEESIIEEKELEISLTGTPKESYSVEDFILSKNNVYIEGSKGQVGKVTQITGSVNIENAEKNFSQRVQLTPIDKNGNKVEGVIISENFVVAEVKMQKNKEVPVKLIISNTNGEQIASKALEADLDTVTITGTAEKIDAISEIKTQTINVSELNQFPAKKYDLEIIPGIKLSASKIGVVHIPEEEQDYGFAIPKEKVQLLGEIDREAIEEKLPENIEVSFKSGKEYANIIKPEQIKLYIDNSKKLDAYTIKYVIEYPVTDMLINPLNINAN